MTATCPACNAEQAQALLCSSCCDVLERDLGDVRALMTDLDISASKQAKIGGGGGKGAPARERNPVNWNAVAVADDLTNTLTTWARDVSGKRWSRSMGAIRIYRDPRSRYQGPLCHGYCWHESCNQMETFDNIPVDPASVQAATYLLGHIDAIRRHPKANELLDEITDAIKRARRAIDRPQDRAYLGQCLMTFPDPDGREVTCLAEIYARVTARETSCKVCGAEHEVAERRAWLLQRAQDTILSVKDASLMIGEVGGIKVSQASIRGYLHRGRLAYRPGVTNGIRLGDLLDVLLDESERKSA